MRSCRMAIRTKEEVQRGSKKCAPQSLHNRNRPLRSLRLLLYTLPQSGHAILMLLSRMQSASDHSGAASSRVDADCDNTQPLR
jgi:hypothetical protein